MDPDPLSILDQPGGESFTWDVERFRSSMSPAARRNWDRHSRVIQFQLGTYRRLFPWMSHPFLAFIQAFWIGLLDEGPYQLLKPRWGGLTFGWLNDGIKPTVWHTWRQLTHGQDDPYTGIYPRGAPKSLKEAQEWDQAFRARRD